MKDLLNRTILILVTIILLTMGVMSYVVMDLEKEVQAIGELNESIREELLESTLLNIRLEHEITQLKESKELLLDKQLDLENKLKKERDKVVPKVTRGSTVSSKTTKVFEATAYCPCPICCGKWSGGATKSGVMPKAGRTIAVDPKVIPLGSKVEVNGKVYVAEDTGSAINGNIIDIFFNTHNEALNWGRQKVNVRIIE